MVKYFTVILLLFFGLFAESKAQTQWESIEYYYTAGPVSPDYMYDYTIFLGADGQGYIFYRNIDTTHKFAFELGADQVQALTDDLILSGIFTTNYKGVPVSERPLGGWRNNAILVYTDSSGEVVHKNTPFYPQEEYKEGLNNLYVTIKSYAPESAMSELDKLLPQKDHK